MSQKHTMKCYTIATLLAGLAGLALGQVWQPDPPKPTSVMLAWDPSPGLGTNDGYNLYESATLAQWTLLTNVPASQCQVTVRVVPGVHFFTCAASNMWGQSEFSNVVDTPPVAVSPSGLRIYR